MVRAKSLAFCFPESGQSLHRPQVIAGHGIVPALQGFVVAIAAANGHAADITDTVENILNMGGCHVLGVNEQSYARSGFHDCSCVRNRVSAALRSGFNEARR